MDPYENCADEPMVPPQPRAFPGTGRKIGGLPVGPSATVTPASLTEAIAQGGGRVIDATWELDAARQEFFRSRERLERAELVFAEEAAGLDKLLTEMSKGSG